MILPPEFTPKIFSVLKEGISKTQMRQDILSGVIVGIVALPLAIAFAIASGVSPEKGLITAIFAGFIISAFGGSRVQIGGPTGAFIVIVFGIVQKYGVEGLTLATFMAGFIIMAMGFLRFGTLLKYIPHPLIVGFTSGIAVIIFSSQIGDFLGLGLEKLPSGFLEKWAVYFENFQKINFLALGIGVLTILTTFYLPKLTNKIPGSLAAILLTTFLVQYFKIPVATIETKFGEIPNTLPMPHFYALSFQQIRELISPAFAIALLGAIESLLSAVVADGMIGSQHRSNMELVAQGGANIVSAVLGGIPATGAIARTATNVKNGGRTPIAGIVHALTLLVIMLVAIWALRLAIYIAARNWGHPEDYRYQAIRRRNDPGFTFKSLYLVFFLQAGLAWVISLPLLGAILGTAPLGWLDVAGVLLWLLGFVFEAGGDWQLARFKADPANRGKVMDRGFWRYTRHPNYFGDFSVWWGFFLIGLSAGAWWALPGPLLMSVLLLRVSGVALLEKSIGKRRPGYEDYVRRTNAFFPWLPKA